MKRILLKDEEIRELVYSLGKHLKSKDVAKAQLKKVAEWLDGFTFYDDAEGESAKSFKKCIKDMLLKEIECDSQG